MILKTSNEAIKYVLQNFAEIKKLVNDRIYDGLIPEHMQQLPVINFFQIDAPNLECNAERERFQISCRADTAIKAKELAHQVHRAINNIQGTYSGFDIQNCYYDSSQFIIEESGIYHVPVDIFIFYVRT